VWCSWTGGKPEEVFRAAIGLLYKMFEGMVGSKTGLEFLVGIQEGRKMGARIVYGDQDVNVTMSRLQSAVMEVRLTLKSHPERCFWSEV
jgi:hypothetical protein